MNLVVAHLVEQVIVVRLVIHLRIHSHINQVLWILMRTFSELVSVDSTSH